MSKSNSNYKDEFRVVWKREGWRNAMINIYAKKDSALRQVERIKTAMTWKGEPSWQGDEAFEGPWEPDQLLYVKLQKRRVTKRWEDLSIESPTD